MLHASRPARRETSANTLRLSAKLCATLSVLSVGLVACTAPNPDFFEAEPDASAADVATADVASPSDAQRDAPATPPVDASRADGPPGTSTPDGSQDLTARGDAAPVFGSAKTLGAWTFEDGAGSTTAADVSGEGAHGTLVDLDPQQAWVAGRKGGGALRFMPSSTLRAPGVRIDAPRIRALKTFTIAAWVLRASNPATQITVISQQLDTGNDEVFNLGAVNDALNMYLPTTTDGAVHRVRSNSDIPIGVWTHVAATFDGMTARLYFNGTEAGNLTYARALPTSTAPVFIGININAANTQPFFGDIDDVAIFDNALSPADVARLATP